MRIIVKLYGNLKSFAPGKAETANVEVAPGTTIAALLTHLGVPDSRVWMSAVNDTVTGHDAVLHENDVLEVFEPVGGGSQPHAFDKSVQLYYSRASLSRGIKGA